MEKGGIAAAAVSSDGSQILAWLLHALCSAGVVFLLYMGALSICKPLNIWLLE